MPKRFPRLPARLDPRKKSPMPHSGPPVSRPMAGAKMVTAPVSARALELAVVPLIQQHFQTHGLDWVDVQRLLITVQFVGIDKLDGAQYHISIRVTPKLDFNGDALVDLIAALRQFCTYEPDDKLVVNGRTFTIGDGDDAGAAWYDSDGSFKVWLRHFANSGD